MENIFVLKLTNNKLFIGKTKKNNISLKHINSDWVNKNNFVEILDFYKSTDIFEENNLTKKYMMKYGIENVRGGMYRNTELCASVINLLQDEFKYINQDNENDYENSFLTKSSIKKEIKKLENLCQNIIELKNSIVSIKATCLNKEFVSYIDNNIYENYTNFISNNFNVKINQKNITGNKKDIVQCNQLLETIYNIINETYKNIYPLSCIFNDNSSEGMNIKIKKIYIYHNNINKKIQELLLSHTKQFDTIQDIYDVINYLLDKQIELEEVNETFLDDDETFLDDDETFLDDDETTLTNDNIEIVSDNKKNHINQHIKINKDNETILTEDTEYNEDNETILTEDTDYNEDNEEDESQKSKLNRCFINESVDLDNLNFNNISDIQQSLPSVLKKKKYIYNNN